MLPDADHDGGAELRDRHAGLAQRLAGLLPRAQVLGEVGGGVAEAAEVDDAAARRRAAAALPKALAAAEVALAEALAPGHAVHQVVGDADAVQGRRRASPGRSTSPATTSTRPAQSRPSSRCGSRDQHAHAPAGVEQARHQPAADVAGGAGDQDERSRADAGAVRMSLPLGRTGRPDDGALRTAPGRRRRSGRGACR